MVCAGREFNEAIPILSCVISDVCLCFASPPAPHPSSVQSLNPPPVCEGSLQHCIPGLEARFLHIGYTGNQEQATGWFRASDWASGGLDYKQGVRMSSPIFFSCCEHPIFPIGDIHTLSSSKYFFMGLQGRI